MIAKITIEGHIGDPTRDMISGIDDLSSPFFTATDMAVFISANQNALGYEVTIKSGGGFVDEGFEIYDMLRNTGKPITTIAHQADSIASVIFLAGDTRKVIKSAKPLIHFPFIENLFVEHATADVIEGIHKGVKEVQNQILKVYKERTNASAESLSVIMDKNQSITADMFHALGFAHEVIEDTAQVSNYRLCAKLTNDNSLTIDKMDKKQKQSLLSKIENLVKNLAGNVKNMMLQLADGSANLYFKTEADDIAVGDEVYMDEAFTTPAPEGEHMIEGNRTIVVAVDADGIATISEIKAEADDAAAKKDEEIENLKKQLEDANSLLAAANSEKETLTNENAELKNKVSAFNEAKAKADASSAKIKTELEELKALVLNHTDEGNDKKDLPKAYSDLEHRRKMRALQQR
jgi:ATP-dependent protease ClpP protease subunit